MARKVLLVVALMTPLCFGVSPAGANHVSCGQVIVADTALDSDLRNCPVSGVVIGADDVTLNLNGHTIDGQFGVALNGVDNEAGHTGLEVRDGKIREFSHAVFLNDGTSGAHIHRLIFSRDVTGVDMFLGTGNLVDHNTTTGTSFGVDLTRSDDNRVVDNDLSGGLTGVSIVNGAHNHVVRNRASRNGDHGMSLTDNGTSHNHLERNVVTGNGLDGIFSFGADQNYIAHNDLSGNHENGFELTGFNEFGSFNGSDSNDIVDNTAAGNGQHGILVVGSSDNDLVENRLTKNVEGADLKDDPLGNDIPDTPADNRLIRNTAWLNSDDGMEVSVAEGTVFESNLSYENGDDGFFVSAHSTGTRLIRDQARRNGGDGIDVDRAGTVFQGNGAFSNAELGIEAVRGIVNLGGNRASGNGDPAQCRHIACSP